MHPLSLAKVIESVRRRIAQGDCPTEAPFSREQLENAIVTLATELEDTHAKNLAAANMLERDGEELEELREKYGAAHMRAENALAKLARIEELRDGYREASTDPTFDDRDRGHCRRMANVLEAALSAPPTDDGKPGSPESPHR